MERGKDCLVLVEVVTMEMGLVESGDRMEWLVAQFLNHWARMNKCSVLETCMLTTSLHVDEQRSNGERFS